MLHPLARSRETPPSHRLPLPLMPPLLTSIASVVHVMTGPHVRSASERRCGSRSEERWMASTFQAAAVAAPLRAP